MELQFIRSTGGNDRRGQKTSHKQFERALDIIEL
jgi:hypothetical protein